MTIEIPKPAHGSLEWLNLRHRDPSGSCVVGASEVATIMGCNPFQTVTELSVRKLREPEIIPANDAMVRGNVLEPGLLQHASNVLGQRIETPNVMYLRGHFIATLDGRGVEDPSLIVEAKTSNTYSLNDNLPLSWFWQAQAQMYCTGTDSVTFVILDRSQRLGFHTVDFDAESQIVMFDAVHDFCSLIDAGEICKPEMLSLEDIARLHPEPSGEVEIDRNTIAVIEEWQAVKESISLLEKQEKALKTQIARTLMEHEYATVEGKRVLSWKAQSSRRLDTKALSEAHPDIADKFTQQSTFRVLRTIK